MTTAIPSPRTGALLLRALEQSGPRPALAWYGEASRIELSGHVLANWVIKSIGHLHDEIDLAPGELVVLDLPPHWKRLALALAAWSLGAEVVVVDRAEGADGAGADGVGADGADGADGVTVEGAESIEQPRVVITDRPDSALAEDADEVLAVEAVSLAPRWPGELPALVHDWLSEVRGSSDQLGIALPDWSGPAPRGAAGTEEAGAAEPDPARPEAHGALPDAIRSQESTAPQGLAGSPLPRLLVDGDGLASTPETLAALLAGGGIVGPAAVVTPRQVEEEGVTTAL